MGAMGLDSTLNIAHQACAKYSTLNKIAHVNCAKTGDMEIAHVNVLEIAHHFSLCRLGPKNVVLMAVYYPNQLCKDKYLCVIYPYQHTTKSLGLFV